VTLPQAEEILKKKFNLNFQPILFENMLFFDPSPFQQKGSEQ
ncbi:6669_t:CDS:1, partial [Racocetra persica]